MPSPFESFLPKEDDRFAELSKLMTEQATQGMGLVAFGGRDEEESLSMPSQFKLSWHKKNEDEYPIERDDFQLAMRLGSGSEGHVHEVVYGQDQKSTTIVKTRYLKPDQDCNAVWREIFLHKLLTEKAKSSHETGIVELLGYEKDGHKINLFMPKCELTFAKVMPMIREMLAIHEEKQQARFLLFDLFASLVRALNTLAKNHVVHCDIKPENIMLSPDGVDDIVDWCLIDFGCASMPQSDYDAETAFRGTLPYVSPEAILRNENFSPRDVWAVGYLFNEILCPSGEIGNFDSCFHARSEALEIAVLKEEPIFSESDVPSDIHFNSEIEKRDFFRFTQRSLMGQKFLQLVDAAKNGETDFNDCFIFLINIMQDPIVERRPSAVDLMRLLPALETLLPFQRPVDYGKATLLEYFEMWTKTKADEKRNSSLYSLDSGMFGSSSGKRHERHERRERRERDPSLSLSSSFGSTQRPGIFGGSGAQTPSEQTIEEVTRNPRLLVD